MPRTVLVTDAETAPGITVIRSLGRAGWRVIAVSPRRTAPGLRSRYTSSRHVVPSFELAAGRAADAVVDLARREAVDLVIPVSDKAVVSLSGRTGALGDCRLAVAELDALEIARDKARTADLAASIGIPVPRTEVVADRAMAVTIAEKLGYPVVVKPLRSHEAVGSERIVTRSVTYAWGPDDLASHFDEPAPAEHPMLLQELVGGEGVGVELLADRGRPLAAFQHRRLRQVPLSGGMSASRISEELDPQLLDESVRLLERLRWTGLAMVEFRVGPDGHHLLEVNGRVWGSIALAVRAGMDFPRALGDMLVPEAGSSLPTSLDRSYQLGVECRNLELEMRWIAGALVSRAPTELIPAPPSLGEVARVAGGLFDPRNEFDVQTSHDLVPGVLDATGAVARMATHVADRSLERLRS